MTLAMTTTLAGFGIIMMSSTRERKKSHKPEIIVIIIIRVGTNVVYDLEHYETNINISTSKTPRAPLAGYSRSRYKHILHILCI